MSHRSQDSPADQPGSCVAAVSASTGAAVGGCTPRELRARRRPELIEKQRGRAGETDHSRRLLGLLRLRVLRTRVSQQGQVQGIGVIACPPRGGECVSEEALSDGPPAPAVDALCLRDEPAGQDRLFDGGESSPSAGKGHPQLLCRCPDLAGNSPHEVAVKVRAGGWEGGEGRGIAQGVADQRRPQPGA